MAEEMLQNQVDEIRALLDSQLHARGSTLDAQIRKAGRRLPRRIRRHARAVANALALIENPKLSRMVNQPQIRRSASQVIIHLKTIDPRDRFKGRMLNRLGAIAAVLIFTFIVVIYVMVQRGLI
jgi:hypothetical protein